MRAQSSLKKRLLLLALSTVAVVWVGAATFVYFDAREEFDEVLDAHLAQDAALLSAQVSHELAELETLHAPLLHKYARRIAFQVWEGGKILLMHSDKAAQHHLGDAEQGFSNTTVG